MRLSEAYIRQRLHEECEKDRADKRLKAAAPALLAACEAALAFMEDEFRPDNVLSQQLRAAIKLARES